MESPRLRNAVWQAVGYAWQFGYTIVIPLVVLGIGGRLLDRRFDTAPWLFIAGVVLSIIVSSVALMMKALKIMRDMENGNSRPPDRSR